VSIRPRVYDSLPAVLRSRAYTVIDVPRSCGNCSASAKISETSSRFSQSSPNVSTVSKQHSLRDDYFDYAVIIYYISIGRYSYKREKIEALVEKLYFSKKNIGFRFAEYFITRNTIYYYITPRTVPYFPGAQSTILR